MRLLSTSLRSSSWTSLHRYCNWQRVTRARDGFAYISCIVQAFFVQAEDGIRVRTVTGVQTCALPICGDVGGGYDAQRRGWADHVRQHGERGVPPGREHGGDDDVWRGGGWRDAAGERDDGSAGEYGDRKSVV